MDPERFDTVRVMVGIGLAVSLFALAACSSDTPPPGKVGADRDEHGCLPSAGYRFCARTGQCERPWELAGQEGFANEAAAFDAFCASPAPGAAMDEEVTGY